MSTYDEGWNDGYDDVIAGYMPTMIDESPAYLEGYADGRQAAREAAHESYLDSLVCGTY